MTDEEQKSIELGLGRIDPQSDLASIIAFYNQTLAVLLKTLREQEKRINRLEEDRPNTLIADI